MYKRVKRKLVAPIPFFKRRVFGRRESSKRAVSPDNDIELEDCDEDDDGWLVVPEPLAPDGWVLVDGHEYQYQPEPEPESEPGQRTLKPAPSRKHVNQLPRLDNCGTVGGIRQYQTLKAIAIALANDRMFRTCFDFTDQTLIPMVERIMQRILRFGVRPAWRYSRFGVEMAYISITELLSLPWRRILLEARRQDLGTGLRVLGGVPALPSGGMLYPLQLPAIAGRALVFSILSELHAESPVEEGETSLEMVPLGELCWKAP